MLGSFGDVFSYWCGTTPQYVWVISLIPKEFWEGSQKYLETVKSLAKELLLEEHVDTGGAFNLEKIPNLTILVTLQKFNIATEKLQNPNRKVVFQPLFCRGIIIKPL